MGSWSHVKLSVNHNDSKVIVYFPCCVYDDMINKIVKFNSALILVQMIKNFQLSKGTEMDVYYMCVHIHYVFGYQILSPPLDI